MGDKKLVKIGFVGCGFMGQLAHLEKYWKLPGVELTALAEGRRQTAELVARTYGFKKVYPDHVTMLRESDVDAVVAIAPFGLNAALVTDILNAGKHVLTEKAMVTTYTKAQELVALAQSKKLVYQVGYMKRFDPGVQWAKQQLAKWVESEEFGPMQLFRIWCGGGAWGWFNKPPLDAGDEPVDYGLPGEQMPHWMNETARTALGSWLNYCSHQTSLTRYVTGWDFELESAKRFGRSRFINGRFPGRDTHLFMDFAWFEPNTWDEGFEAKFERAKITVNMPSPLAPQRTAKVVAFEHKPETVGHNLEPVLPQEDGFARQAQHFIAAVRGEEEPISPAREAAKEVQFAESVARHFMEQESSDEN